MTSSTTFVTCVEAGGLEPQVLMLAESLRAFGGAWANAPFIAVKPRRGPKLKATTISEFRRLQVEFVDEPFNSKLAWWNNANKSAVMSALEKQVSTPNITWLDGDMVILQPLDDVTPAEHAQFVARAGEGYLGSDGSDANATYWRKLCEIFSLNFADFPEIVSFPERRTIRAYWQGGIYTYRTTTGLGAAHFEVIARLLEEKVGSKQAGIYHQDQVSISLAVQKLKLKHSEFTPAMNFNINPLAKQNANLLAMGDVKILHYHNSLHKPALSWASEYIRQLPPDRVELIQKYTPISTDAALVTRLQRRLLKLARERRATQFAKQATHY
ncbi:hypothetical protein ACWAT4_08965 [Bradyrhizobium manausense]